MAPGGPSSPERLRVLLTIQTLEGQAGASLHVRDCALELLKQGHLPVVYSTRLGALAEDMRRLTIPVIDRLDKLTSKPDVIHGNSPIETVAALLHFEDTPAIFTCHAWDNPDALPPRMPRIIRYLAVDDTCRDQLVCQEGIPESQVLVRFNAVDLNRFPLRPVLPERPRRALVFSNNASESTYVPAVREACARAGVELDVVGQNSGRPHAQPEQILAHYDLVFGKARCALEALATGAAVVVCDAMGLAALVTTHNLDDLRRKNFGRRSLQNRLSADTVLREIEKYDALDAARVAARIRSEEGLSRAVESLLAIYREVLEEAATMPERCWNRERTAAAAFLERIAPFSNTFYATDQIRALTQEAQVLRQKLESLGSTLEMLPLSEADRQQIRLVNVQGPTVVSPGELFFVAVEAMNLSSSFLASYPPFPVYVSYHWLSADGSDTLCFEGLRSEIFPVLPPGRGHRYPVCVSPPQEPGSYLLRVTLVQERVAWLDRPESSELLDLLIVVAS